MSAYEYAENESSATNQVFLKLAGRSPDVVDVNALSDSSMRGLVDHLVEQVPGVKGALISSIDGRVLSSRMPPGARLDPPAIAAMSAATLGLANRLVQLAGPDTATVSVQRSPTGKVFVFAVSESAVLTVVADLSADDQIIRLVGLEVSTGLRDMMAKHTPG